MRLSFSSKETYNTCPKKWDLHYNHKYRSIRTTSALCFGNAIDEALNVLLLTGNYAECEYKFTEIWLSYQAVDTIDYYPSDLNKEILDLTILNTIEAIEDDTKRNHALGWNCLFVKGITMLRAYHTDIYPRIKKVIGVQIPINLIGTLEDGTESEDKISGIIDAICELELEDGSTQVCIMDNKTSSMPYPKNAVNTKEQTALYSLAYPDIEYAAYAVMVKKQLGRTQLLIGKPPEELKEKVLDNFVNVLQDIKDEKFPQNRKSCRAFGQLCCYYSYCHGGGFSNDIYKKED